MIRRLLVSFALVSTAVVSPAVAAPAKHDASVQANKQDKDSYTVELKAVGSYKKGVEGTVELVLTPKGGHHVNPDYPAKFKVKDADGITFPKKVLERKDGDFKETGATLKIPFVAANAGKQKVSGEFKFSVCSDKNCFMEKADLDVEVNVN
jgi:hypothetical protein